MLTGAHSIIYSTNAEADRVFLRDVLKLPHVDVGDGWLIFGLPPAEVAVHPSGSNDVHEFYLMCDDVGALVAKLTQVNVACSPVENLGWGLRTNVTLPGGGKLGIYQPRHARPPSVGAPQPSGKPKKRASARARKAKAVSAPRRAKRRMRSARRK